MEDGELEFMKVILLAAGYATRLYPLTENLPKSLLPLGKRVIIDYIFDSIDKLPNVTEVILVSNSKFYAQFKDWADKQDRAGKAPITILDDGTDSPDNMRGAIGDIMFAIKERSIDEEICIMAGDNIFTYDIVDMYEYYKKKATDTLVAIFVPDVNQLKQLGVAVLDDDGKVLEMQEKSPEPKSNWAIYATYFYTKETLKLFDEYIAEGNSPDAPGRFPLWLCKRKDIYAYKGLGDCIDIGTLENYEKTKEEYEKL